MKQTNKQEGQLDDKAVFVPASGGGESKKTKKQRKEKKMSTKTFLKNEKT